MTTANQHTVFEYLYRDAANYKSRGRLLLDGEYKDVLEEAICKACESWSLFVAEQVGVPTLYAGLYQYSNGPTIDDIAFHEFERLRPANQEDTKSLATWGLLDDLVARFNAVRAWDCTLSPHRN
ncbi:MAG: hypothetical protein JSS42_11490 [Proteobacteria bacterium]|nr:hypothetical protein [Pseudomonadota bacterium]